MAYRYTFNLTSLLLLAASCSSLTSAVASVADDSAWKKYSSSGTTAYEAANYGQAERMFKLAVKEAEKFGDGDLRLAQSLTNLGVLYNFRGQTVKAEPLFEKAIEIKQQSLGSDNKDVLDSVSKLCHFYIKTANYSKAEPISAKIVAYADRTLHDRREVHASFDKLNSYYQKHPDLEEAEILVKQAEELTHKSTVTQDIELAVVLDGVADAYTGHNKFDQAEPLFRRALSLRERALPPNHIALAASQENLAKLYLAENKPLEAEPLYRQALEISQKTLGEHKPETFARLEGLAQCYVKAGNYRQAESMYSGALQSFSNAYGANSKYVFTCQTALSSLLAKQGRYQEAVPLLSQALKSAEKLNGPQHASLSPLLDEYANVLDKTNKHSEANKMRARARAIRG